MSRGIKQVGAIIGLGLLLLGPAVGTDRPPVAPVEGESWLNHLHRQLDETSMGKTGLWGPNPVPEEPPGEAPFAIEAISNTVNLTGADLYRMNCRGCHGESGVGAPPEINSVINPVRATSVAAVMERMKATGMDITRSEAATLANQAKAALLQRIHNGGENMPAFAYLDEAEVRSLYAYLKQLAGIPGAEGEQITVRESSLRLGELIVKSTCHICHSAAGPNPTPQQILDGSIPPLSTLTARSSPSALVRKVTTGAPVLMGAPPLFYRGRMPVFYYLSKSEGLAVYRYLLNYRPFGLASASSDRAELTLSSGAVLSSAAAPPFAPGESSSSAQDVVTPVILLTGACVVGMLVLLSAVGIALLYLRYKKQRARSRTAQRGGLSRQRSNPGGNSGQPNAA